MRLKLPLPGMNKKRAVTLLEFILAVAISSIVFLGLSALYLASGRFYRNITARSGAEEELVLALAHITSRVSPASNIDVLVSSGADRELTVSGDLSGGDPADTADNDTITYSWNSTNQEILFDAGSGDTTVARNITDFVITQVADNYLTISLTAQDPQSPDEDALTIESSVRLRCLSVAMP